MFRLALPGADAVQNVIRADPPVIRLQVLFIQPHHPSGPHPGHRHRQHVGGVGSLKPAEAHCSGIQRRNRQFPASDPQRPQRLPIGQTPRARRLHLGPQTAPTSRPVLAPGKFQFFCLQGAASAPEARRSWSMTQRRWRTSERIGAVGDTRARPLAHRGAPLSEQNSCRRLLRRLSIRLSTAGTESPYITTGPRNETFYINSLMIYSVLSPVRVAE